MFKKLRTNNLRQELLKKDLVIREQARDIENLKKALHMSQSEANEYRKVLENNVKAVLEKAITSDALEETDLEITTIQFPRAIIGVEYSKRMLRDIRNTLNKYS